MGNPARFLERERERERERELYIENIEKSRKYFRTKSTFSMEFGFVLFIPHLKKNSM
jgi:hypothetical protein